MLVIKKKYLLRFAKDLVGFTCDSVTLKKKEEEMTGYELYLGPNLIVVPSRDLSALSGELNIDCDGKANSINRESFVSLSA